VIFILSNLFFTTAYAKKYDYSNAEFEMLAKTIKAEAGRESMEGKIAVANVIMNRVFGYNSSIQYILTTPNQFAYSPNTVPNAECYEAARKVLDDGVWVVPKNCYYFKTSPPPINGYATWSGRKDDIRPFWGKIGSHFFYLRDPDGKFAVGGRIEPPMYTYEYETPRLGTAPSDEVIKIQELLIACGYEEVEADGYFGEKTDEAVKDFQEKAGIEADGIVGDTTFELIETSAIEIVANRKKKEREEYIQKVEPYLDIVYKRKLILETLDEGFITLISKYIIDVNMSKLEEFDYPTEIIVIEEDSRNVDDVQYLSNMDDIKN